MNTHAGSRTKRPNPSTPSTKSRSTQLVKSTKAHHHSAKIKPQEIRAPGTSYAAANYSIPSISLHRSIQKFPFNFFSSSLSSSSSYRTTRNTLHSPTERNETKQKKYKGLSEKGRGERKKGLVFISCTQWQQRSKPNPQRRSAWVIIPVRGAVAPPVAVPGLLRLPPISSTSLSFPFFVALPYPPIRRGALFVVFKLLLVSLFLSSSQFGHIGVGILRHGDPAAHRFAFFSSSLRDAGYNSDCEAFGAGRRYEVG